MFITKCHSYLSYVQTIFSTNLLLNYASSLLVYIIVNVCVVIQYWDIIAYRAYCFTLCNIGETGYLKKVVYSVMLYFNPVHSTHSHTVHWNSTTRKLNEAFFALPLDVLGIGVNTSWNHIITECSVSNGFLLFIIQWRIIWNRTAASRSEDNLCIR